jgi:hypothetical protein
MKIILIRDQGELLGQIAGEEPEITAFAEALRGATEDSEFIDIEVVDSMFLEDILALLV